MVTRLIEQLKKFSVLGTGKKRWRFFFISCSVHEFTVEIRLIWKFFVLWIFMFGPRITARYRQKKNREERSNRIYDRFMNSFKTFSEAILINNASLRYCALFVVGYMKIKKNLLTGICVVWLYDEYANVSVIVSAQNNRK